jgi:hypothetical protein
MDKVKGKAIKVPMDSLCLEVLSHVRDALVNATSMGVTPLLYDAVQHLFSPDAGFFADPGRSRALDVDIARGGERGSALHYVCQWAADVCQWAAVAFAAAVHDAPDAKCVVDSARAGRMMPNTPISVYDITLAMQREREWGGTEARVDMLRVQLGKAMAAGGVHAHYARFTGILCRLHDLGVPYVHGVKSIFMRTLPTEVRNHACLQYSNASGGPLERLPLVVSTLARLQRMGVASRTQ